MKRRFFSCELRGKKYKQNEICIEKDDVKEAAGIKASNDDNDVQRKPEQKIFKETGTLANNLSTRPTRLIPWNKLTNLTKKVHLILLIF